MKKLILLGIFAVAGSVSAYATNFTVTQVCESFSASGAAGSGNASCPSFGTLDGGNTIVSAALVYLGDYSSGLTASVTETTQWTFGGAFTGSPFVDTVTTSGGSGSALYSSSALGTSCTSDQMNANPVGCSNASNQFSVPPTLAGFVKILSGYSNATVINAAYVNAITSGSALATSGTAELVLTYSTSTTTPEPTTFVLMGAGLGLIGMLRRKATRR